MLGENMTSNVAVVNVGKSFLELLGKGLRRRPLKLYCTENLCAVLVATYQEGSCRAGKSAPEDSPDRRRLENLPYEEISL